jgi:hypothetical protein
MAVAMLSSVVDKYKKNKLASADLEGVNFTSVESAVDMIKSFDDSITTGEIAKIIATSMLELIIEKNLIEDMKDKLETNLLNKFYADMDKL